MREVFVIVKKESTIDEFLEEVTDNKEVIDVVSIDTGNENDNDDDDDETDDDNDDGGDETDEAGEEETVKAVEKPVKKGVSPALNDEYKSMDKKKLEELLAKNKEECVKAGREYNRLKKIVKEIKISMSMKKNGK